MNGLSPSSDTDTEETRSFWSSPWNEMALLALMIMQLSWIVPWYRLLTASIAEVSALQVFLVFGLALLGANLVFRIAVVFDLEPNRRRLLFASFLILMILIGLKMLLYANEALGVFGLVARIFQQGKPADVPQTWIPAEFVVIGAMLLVIYSGASLANRQTGIFTVSSRFQLGVVMLLLFGIVDQSTPWAMLFTFFASGFLALTTARITTMTRLRGGSKIPFERQKVIGITGAVLGLVLLAGLATAVLLSPQMATVFAGLLGILQFLGLKLLQLLSILLTPVVWFLINLISRIITWLFQVAGSELSPEVTPVPLATPPPLFGELLEEAGRTSPFEAPLFRYLFLVGILLLLAALIWRQMWVTQRLNVTGADVITEPLEDEDLLSRLKASLRKSASSLGGRFASTFRLGRAEREKAAARIRQIYAELLELGKALDQPRQESQTPSEYLPVLKRIFPGYAADLQHITQAYQQVRYGELPETTKEVNAVEDAWKKISANGEEQLKAWRSAHQKNKQR